jgi:hypothetical protein
MGWVEKNTGIDLTIDELSKPVSKVLGPVEDAVKDAGSAIDDFVNEQIPGGWYTVAALGGAAYYGMPSFGAEGLSAAEAQFIAADAAQLANQGLSTAQITSTLSYAGVPTGLAETAATYAGMGLPEAEIYSYINNTIPVSEVGKSASKISTTDVLKAANQLSGLMGGQQQPTAVPQAQQIGQQTAPSGVDYSGVLNLLASRQPQTGLLGTQYQPDVPNLSTLLG